MQKTMTAQELYDYIRCFTTVIVGEEQESSFLFYIDWDREFETE